MTASTGNPARRRSSSSHEGGAVKIRHEKAPDGTVKSRVEAPRGVKTELVKHNG